MWVARDKNGTLRGFTTVKPWRDYDCEENEQKWITDEDPDTECVLPSELYPQFNSLTWEDEPIVIELFDKRNVYYTVTYCGEFDESPTKKFFETEEAAKDCAIELSLSGVRILSIKQLVEPLPIRL